MLSIDWFFCPFLARFFLDFLFFHNNKMNFFFIGIEMELDSMNEWRFFEVILLDFKRFLDVRWERCDRILEVSN